jgi:hypothetical protein
MAHHDDKTGDEAKVRQLIDDRVKAMPPLEYRGAAAHRQRLEEWFATFTHEHLSAPFEMTPPFRASLDLTP